MEEEIEEEKTQRPDSPLPLNMEGWKKKKNQNQTSKTFQSLTENLLSVQIIKISAAVKAVVEML